MVLSRRIIESVVREEIGNEARSGDEIVVVVAGYKLGKKMVNVATDDTEDFDEGVSSKKGSEGHHDPREVLGFEGEAEHECSLLFRIRPRPNVDDRHD